MNLMQKFDAAKDMFFRLQKLADKARQEEDHQLYVDLCWALEDAHSSLDELQTIAKRWLRHE